MLHLGRPSLEALKRGGWLNCFAIPGTVGRTKPRWRFEARSAWGIQNRTTEGEYKPNKGQQDNRAFERKHWTGSEEKKRWSLTIGKAGDAS